VKRILTHLGLETSRQRICEKGLITEAAKEEAGVRPSLAAVARAAQVSVSTASLAMRGSNRVKEETGARVKAVAEQLGYQAHPYIGAQLAAVRRGKTARVRACLGYLYADSAVSTPWKSSLRKLYGPKRRFEASCASARRYGYTLEPFIFRDPGCRPRRLQQILESRGIRGLLLDFPAYLATGQDFDFLRFNCISFNEQYAFRPHVFGNNDFQNIMKMFCQLWRMGYRRIGFAIGDSRMVSSAYRPEAAFRHCQHHIVPEDLRIPLLYEESWMEAFLKQIRNGLPPVDFHRIGQNNWLLEQDWSDLHRKLDEGGEALETTLLAIIERWMEEHRPEVVICEDNRFKTRLERIGYAVPEDVGLAHAHLDMDVKDWTGIRTAEEELADAAVRELNHSIEVGRFGLVNNPLHVRFTGEWIEGKTTRPVKEPITEISEVARRWIRIVLNEPVQS
jgi:LacI family transcriptional regulator